MKVRKGYVATVTVLLVMAVVLSIIMTVTMLSIGSLQAAWALESGEMSLAITESCMEEALLKSRNNISYSGGTISFPEGSCDVTISKNGQTWTLTAASQASSKYKRTIRVVINRAVTGVTLVSWNEI